MLSRHIILLLASTSMLITTACSAMPPIAAERCVLVDLQQEGGRELFPLLKAFADANGLEPELSHPIYPRYLRGSRENSRAEVAYRIGFGHFGALLTLFRFDTSQDADLVEAFDRFVEHEVASRHKVTQCGDVPNFKVPIIYR